MNENMPYPIKQTIFHFPFVQITHLTFTSQGEYLVSLLELTSQTLIECTLSLCHTRRAERNLDSFIVLPRLTSLELLGSCIADPPVGRHRQRVGHHSTRIQIYVRFHLSLPLSHFYHRPPFSTEAFFRRRADINYVASSCSDRMDYIPGQRRDRE
jgi:hypothetical protein